MATHTLSRMVHSIWDCGVTLFLFTYTDFKTIIGPVTCFAIAVAPLASLRHLLSGIFWIWLHLLQCNVSNQYKSVVEDAINRPWRPLPAGRISATTATILRWALVPTCIGLSALYGADLALTSASLTAVTIAYDEFKLAGHWFGKNLSAMFGYTVFEIGATKLMGKSTSLDEISLQAISMSALVILTTIHAQDCPDVTGDRALGRVTLPIYAPELSRIILLLLPLLWSVHLIGLWRIEGLAGAVFCALGVYIGWRYYALRSNLEDKTSYKIYNAWLLVAHLLPFNMRYKLM
ncbi:UbiA prenyltransferase family [Favolaschia claudopus]|uniref:UbiA prenyltransferase family n=1 Tax=Favolaschia claudopus TaxID=2862362 RepID=A0AAW0DU92_9AGAR